jgi:hydrogenase maturation protease
VNRRILVAGVGNIFLADDGFGVEVARRLDSEDLPPGVEVKDFGVRGVHLAYELLDGCETLILIDTLSRGERPGTVFALEPDLDEIGVSLADAHGMDPRSVFALVKALDGRVGRVFVVGCEPAEFVERIGLSESVGQAVENALRVVRRLIADSLDNQTVSHEEG